MTRINVVPPRILTRQHLVSEHRELPRVFGLSRRAHGRGWTPNKAPRRYTLGSGHVVFFYAKLAWCAERHTELVEEMERRGYAARLRLDNDRQRMAMPVSLWKDWEPSPEELELNLSRLKERDPDAYAGIGKTLFFSLRNRHKEEASGDARRVADQKPMER